jgi:tripartite ATP-independent transporter DctP family solute receptor
MKRHWSGVRRNSFIWGVLLAAVAQFSIVARPADAADYKDEYRLSLVVTTAFPWGMAAQRWADLVKERTSGRINIKLYPGPSLVSGDQTREFTAIRQGLIDLAVGHTLNWSPQVKELNVFNLPFLMPDFAAIDAITASEVGQKLFELIEKQGVKPLAWGSQDFRQIHTTNKPIRSPEDLKGLKIRIVGSPLLSETFTALGANPAELNWGDAQAALGSGALDGLENPMIVAKRAQFYKLGIKHSTMWNYSGGQLVFVVNPKVWESWTPEDRRIVQATAIQVGMESRVLERQGLVQPEDWLIRDIRDSGVQVTYLNDSQLAAFRKATRGVYEKWTKTIGEDLVTRAEKAVAQRYQR